MRVLHVLHHSAPYLDGYGVRSKYIVDFQRRIGLQPLVVTSAHHEMEVARPAIAPGTIETIDHLPYHRTPLPNGRSGRWRLRTPMLRELALMSSLRASLERTLATEKIDVVHAHSPVLCGRPALDVARRHGVPVVYEVRAFWEDAFLLGTDRFSLASAKYRYGRAIETALLRKVDAVIAISQHMIEDIAARGVDRSRLFKMPNGVDATAFAPIEPDVALAERLGLNGGHIIGFIGTTHLIEGLDCLVRAMPAILAQVPSARLLVVGTGPEDDNIRRQVRELGLQHAVIQTGRVAHDTVKHYYSIMDLLVYPRHRFRVTELVTPLKPLEAMALGKPVIGSDVGGIKELLDDGKAGLLFKAGDERDLADRVLSLLKDPAARAQLAATGRTYVLGRRRWDALVPDYVPIYERLVHGTMRRAS